MHARSGPRNCLEQRTHLRGPADACICIAARIWRVPARLRGGGRVLAGGGRLQVPGPLRKRDIAQRRRRRCAGAVQVGNIELRVEAPVLVHSVRQPVSTPHCVSATCGPRQPRAGVLGTHMGRRWNNCFGSPVRAEPTLCLRARKRCGKECHQACAWACTGPATHVTQKMRRGVTSKTELIRPVMELRGAVRFQSRGDGKNKAARCARFAGRVVVEDEACRDDKVAA